MRKTILLSVIAAFLAINVNAQSDDEKSKLWDFDEWQKNIRVVVKKADTKPEFQGGFNALFNYFDNKIQVPDSVQIIYSDLSGRLFCIVDIDENGKITNVDLSLGNIERGGFFSGGFMANTKTSEKDGTFEFIRSQMFALVKSMPNWTPAKLNGKNVKSTIDFAIQYDLKESMPNIYMLDGKEITEEEYWGNMMGGHTKFISVMKRNQLFEGKKVNIAFLTTKTEK